MTGETPEHACLDALRTAAERLGRSPSKAAYEDLGLTPASATIVRVVGGWNEAKRRAGLETNPSTGTRVEAPPADVPEDVRRRWNELSVDQRWHYRNVEWNAARTLRRRGRLRAWVNERKGDTGCARCGESDPACLDFHHRADEPKEDSICDMITNGYGTERLQQEMEKCAVLCANCHRKEHFVDPLARLESEPVRASDGEPVA